MTAPALAAAVAFVRLGMVLAISFLEVPLKFRAPGITVPLGVGIGRLVFRALNLAEGVLALVLLGCAVLAPDALLGYAVAPSASRTRAARTSSGRSPRWKRPAGIPSTSSGDPHSSGSAQAAVSCSDSLCMQESHAPPCVQ